MKSFLPLTRLLCIAKKSLVNDVVIGQRLNQPISRTIHITSSTEKEIRGPHTEGRKLKVGSADKYKGLDAPVTGPIYGVDVDRLYPEEGTPNWLFDGIPYKDLPIVDVKVSPNNTILSLSDCDGKAEAAHSAGMEGFKNARKGTNIAAQQAAITFCETIKKNGYHQVRLRLRGLGPGRMAVLKGLQLGGVKIVSITDTTRVTWNPPRPRKARRI